MTPEELVQSGPQGVSDLIGPAALIARVQCAKAASNKTGVPVKILLYGEPGCGKSAICGLLSASLRPMGTVGRVSGRQLNSDMVREWISGAYFRSESWVVRVIEEADMIPPDAQALILQYMDTMGAFHALLCTSNKGMGELSDRFQSRFQTIEVCRPRTEHVADLLRRRWPAIADQAEDIAGRNRGDVRASLHDAQMHLDVQVYGTDVAR